MVPVANEPPPLKIIVDLGEDELNGLWCAYVTSTPSKDQALWCAFVASSCSNDPHTWKAALQSKFAEDWCRDYLEELTSICKHNVYVLVPQLDVPAV